MPKIISLLPKAKQEEIHYEDSFNTIVKFFSVSASILMLGVLAQFGTRFYLRNESVRLDTDIERLKGAVSKQENAELKKKIVLINGQINDFKNLAAETPAWSNVLDRFTSLVPDGVRIASFNAEIEKKKVDITGVAATREGVLQLYQNIFDDKENFKDIDYPLENLINPYNSNFHFSFYIQEEALKLP